MTSNNLVRPIWIATNLEKVVVVKRKNRRHIRRQN
jgi:hypothetical protein